MREMPIHGEFSIRGNALFLTCLFAGCALLGQNDFKDVLQEPPSKWSDDDCRAVIVNATSCNLRDDQGKLLKPKAVWGRRQNTLTKEETLLIMFQLRWGSYHFLAGSQKIYLNFEKLGDKIHLEFPIVKIQ